ncbi:hypothetical protein [Vibrio scophthalmi]|uniref:Uncharacterized protein n=1 Tax=Vibrio scophthalmi TaxID=45658 RepID=A0A1E3WMF1_9VIBR|nr:hypothetical protein [Vibrio scophthalmi]ODS10950.1 hypothetical protein VSF3289_01211 [Vibrio scophthalmi]
MQKCNCFEEKLNQIAEHLKEKISPDVTEFNAQWEGATMLFSGETVPATLTINYQYRGVKRDKTPNKNITKDYLRIFFSFCPICGNKIGDHTKDSAVSTMRNAIQSAEEFGLVRTESGQVITGAKISADGIVLVKE